MIFFKVSVWWEFVFICLPDRPLEGRGSLSDWMGSAGDLSREAASACSQAQLSAHRMTWSAQGASIPKTSLWSFHPVASENYAEKTPSRLITSKFFRAEKSEKFLYSISLFPLHEITDCQKNKS